MTAKPDVDHLRQWIGRTQEASDVITAQLVKGLRATLFLDIGNPAEGDIAPFTTHWCLAQPVAPMSEIGADGHPARGGFCRPYRCRAGCGPAGRSNSSTRCGSATR